MILKEKQLTSSQDPKIRAGEEAEKQMAFYLQRTFGKAKDCFVLNDLRIVYDDDVAQMDHLMVSRYGLFIIESKSVHGKIAINKQNEWSRTYNNETQGMRSPVLQAEEQGKILRALLIDNKQKLLSKLLGTLQKGFAHCPINIYVAISDAGIIERKTTIDELFKADQISNEIEEKLKKLKNLCGPLSLSFEGGWSISTEEVKKVADFLFLQHQPLHKANIKNQEAISKIAETKSLPPITKATSEKTFIPKAGATCPVCNQHKLIRKSVPRSDGTETDFLACAGYPIECKTIFPLVAIVKKVGIITNTGAENNDLKENDTCPRCKTGKLLLRKAKTEFLGCSQYPKCKFTDYRKLA